MAQFHLKQFSLENSNSAMKITTDSILLGAWADVRGCNKILDIGTGTGIVALMVAQKVAQKVAQSTIIGIDIDEASAIEAASNFASSPWASILQARHCSLSEFVKETQKESFDLIISNPPFFENSLKSPNSRRSDARHTDSLPLPELLKSAFELLSPKGKFALILPYDLASNVIVDALGRGFYLHRECYIKSSENKPPRRALLEFRKEPDTKITTQTIVLGGDVHRNLVADFITNL